MKLQRVPFCDVKIAYNLNSCYKNIVFDKTSGKSELDKGVKIIIHSCSIDITVNKYSHLGTKVHRYKN